MISFGLQLTYVLIAAVAITAISMIGILFAWKGLRGWFETNLPYLVSFSAGVFLVVSWDIIKEILELSENNLIPIIAIIIGIAITYLVSKLFPGSHHHENPDCKHTHSESDARSMFLGDSIHSAADGILLAPAFLISPLLGLTTALGMAFHETVQELSEFFVYKKAGFTTKKAIKWNIMSSSPIFIGAIAGLFIAQVQFLVVPLLGFTAGTFIYILFTDLIPDSYNEAKSKSRYVRHLFSVILGIILMLIIFGIGS